MNLRKSLFTTVAAIGLMVSIAAPLAMAAEDDNTGNNSTTATVQITPADGVFDVKFCSASANLAVATQPSAAPGVANGELWICYTDTKPARSAFTVDLEAGDFSNGTNTIDASNFRVTYAYNVSQTQWGSASAPHHVCDGHTTVGHSTTCSETVPLPNGDIGDIGYRQNDGGIVAQTSAGTAWTANNTLDTPREVQFGYAGIGTIDSNGALAVKLTIPGGTPGGSYTSNLELSVTIGSTP